MNKQEKLNTNEIEVLFEVNAKNVDNSSFDIEEIIKAFKNIQSDFKDINTFLIKVVSKKGYLDRVSYETDSDASKYVASMRFKVLDYYDYWPEYHIKNVLEEIEDLRDSLSYKADQVVLFSFENLPCNVEKIAFVRDEDEENSIVMLLYTNN